MPTLDQKSEESQQQTHTVSYENVYPPMESTKQEDFEDTKRGNQNPYIVKNRQHSDQKKKYKRTNNDLQNIHVKLKIK